MGTGVIYGVHIERSQKDGAMMSGPVVTLCVRLPEWCVLDNSTEAALRQRLQEAMSSAIEVVTESEKSKARRLEQNLMGSKP